eukprot:851404-Prorocentrum_minimum.AAC.2
MSAVSSVQAIIDPGAAAVFSSSEHSCHGSGRGDEEREEVACRATFGRDRFLQMMTIPLVLLPRQLTVQQCVEASSTLIIRQGNKSSSASSSSVTIIHPLTCHQARSAMSGIGNN